MKMSQDKSFVRDSILVLSGGPGESWIEESDEYDVLRLCVCVCIRFIAQINRLTHRNSAAWSIRYITILMLRYKKS